MGEPIHLVDDNGNELTVHGQAQLAGELARGWHIAVNGDGPKPAPAPQPAPKRQTRRSKK